VSDGKLSDRLRALYFLLNHSDSLREKVMPFVRLSSNRVHLGDPSASAALASWIIESEDSEFLAPDWIEIGKLKLDKKETVLMFWGRALWDGEVKSLMEYICPPKYPYSSSLVIKDRGLQKVLMRAWAIAEGVK